MFSLGLLIWIAVFCASLFVLIFASSHFTSSAEKFGHMLGIPPFIIGVTIVALGTSLPELISSIFAVTMDSAEIVIGNVIGSNITNIFLILGCTAIAGKSIKLKYNVGYVDLPLMIGATFLMTLMIWDSTFSLFEAILSLLGMLVYLLYTAHSSVTFPSHSKKAPSHQYSKKNIGRILIPLGLSGFFIYLGARYTVESIIRLSESLSIGKEVIAASAVALGTSLPELTVSLTAVHQGDSEMAVGNILGSNIFNIFAVMGIPALFGTLTVPRTILIEALPILIIATLLFAFITQLKRITQWEGWILILFYILFLSRLFVQHP